MVCGMGGEVLSGKAGQKRRALAAHLLFVSGKIERMSSRALIGMLALCFTWLQAGCCDELLSNGVDSDSGGYKRESSGTVAGLGPLPTQDTRVSCYGKGNEDGIPVSWAGVSGTALF